jgi:hypothetical protein
MRGVTNGVDNMYCVYPNTHNIIKQNFMVAESSMKRDSNVMKK